eukprot:3149451-Rhodomonas_salina.1
MELGRVVGSGRKHDCCMITPRGASSFSLVWVSSAVRGQQSAQAKQNLTSEDSWSFTDSPGGGGGHASLRLMMIAGSTGWGQLAHTVSRHVIHCPTQT